MKKLGKISEVSSALQDPIKSLGVFTKFARKRMSNMMGSKTLTKAHPELKEQAEKFSSMLGKFAIAVEDTLIKYGKNIVDNELPQGRLADMVIELYVIISVISRTTAILNSSKATQEQKDYVLRLTKYICNESGRKIRRNLKAVSKNNDKLISKISESEPLLPKFVFNQSIKKIECYAYGLVFNKNKFDKNLNKPITKTNFITITNFPINQNIKLKILPDNKMLAFESGDKQIKLNSSNTTNVSKKNDDGGDNDDDETKRSITPDRSITTNRHNTNEDNEDQKNDMTINNIIENLKKLMNVKDTITFN
jgi:hypothetical protein